MKTIILVFSFFVVCTTIAPAQGGIKKKRAQPHEYGNVVINNYSDKAGLAPVEFSHWLHRGMYTCRLCHVDLAFAMKAGATEIRAADNRKGSYCGACHNGKTLHNNKTVFAACQAEVTQEAAARCERCHSAGRRVRKEIDFDSFTQAFPRERFGNGVNWDKAEEAGLIKLVDFVDGISFKRKGMAVQKDFSLTAKVAGMPDILFSHARHTVWNGCEVCHPEIFIGVKRGASKYSMVEIFDGKYCGACHGKVSFPLLDCQRCHTKPVS